MKKRGRPRKNGVVGPEHFLRACLVMDAYSQARSGGEKHIAAVEQTVAVVRQQHPEMPISMTEVKRVLAEQRPQNSPIELKVECEILEGDEAARQRAFFAEMEEFAGTKTPKGLTDQELRKPLRVFKFGFGERTKYPRHNARRIPNSDPSAPQCIC